MLISCQCWLQARRFLAKEFVEIPEVDPNNNNNNNTAKNTSNIMLATVFIVIECKV